MSYYALFLVHCIMLGTLSAAYWNFFRRLREGIYFSDRYLHGLVMVGFFAFCAGSLLSQYELLLMREPRFELVGWNMILFSVSLATMGVALSVLSRVLQGWEEAQIRRWVWFDLWLIVLVVSALFASLHARTIAPHFGLILFGWIQIFAANRRVRLERR